VANQAAGYSWTERKAGLSEIHQYHWLGFEKIPYKDYEFPVGSIMTNSASPMMATLKSVSRRPWWAWRA